MELRLLFLVLKLGQAIYLFYFFAIFVENISAGINKSNALIKKILVFPLLFININMLCPHFSFVSLARAMQRESCITCG